MDYSDLTDKDVVRQALDGRESAHRELVRRYERPVFSLIYRMVHDRELTEDLAQETFVKAFNALDRYKPEYKFSSWIFKIANNRAIDELRKKEIPTLSLDGSPHATSQERAEETAPTAVATNETPEEFTEHRALGREIDRAVAGLRPEYRTAVVLYHIEGRSYDEIAEVMELPLGTVKTYMHRARKEMRQELAHLRN